ncbi:MAG: hypothetical protein JO340_07105 [Acidobacteriaceae bacterium]|nr:hypothetical protein [Acidobacteriaceae bacterium]
MTLDYLPRLFALALAVFFLLHSICGLVASFAARPAIRFFQSFSPRIAARLVLTLRFLPFAIALFLAIGVCVPGYLRYEPEARAEPVGLLCLACSGLCVLTCLLSTRRAICALRATSACLRRPVSLSPCVAGIFVPRIVVPLQARNLLSPDELGIAIAHERAHAAAHDNLKRLLLLLAPGVAPFFRGYDLLEQAWARLAEWAADDDAVSRQPARALSLAAALVRLSRSPHASHASCMTASLLLDASSLAVRVDRLLDMPSPPRRPNVALAASLAALLLTGALVILARAPSLLTVHAFLERFIH